MINPIKTRALRLLAESLDDIERTRIATENRLRAAQEDIEALGSFGLLVFDPLIELNESLNNNEKGAIKALEKMMKQHDLGPWVKNNVGVGLKQGARLIAAIGDPAYNEAEGRLRRGPAELWAYTGYHVEQGKRPKHRRGEQSNWNATAKMRARLVAESCIKQRHSPFRPVYDRARAAWAERDTTDGHKHNHALGVTTKALLKDLHLTAKTFHVKDEQ
jgi:hypothetical protein